MITWETYDHGRNGELTKLNKLRNDYTQSPVTRRAADKNHAKIVHQLRDKKLMRMRHRLIQAGRAGDRLEIARITAMMKAHTKEDRETGHYGV
jgi:hypothetical protein